MAYYTTTNDFDAAYVAGMPFDAFARWRERNGLPRRGNWREQYRLRYPTTTDTLKREAYRAQKNDLEAARWLGMPPDQFRVWRLQVGLPPKDPYDRSEEDVDAERYAQMISAYIDQPSDLKAAKTLGIKYEKFAAWRAAQGLPAKGKAWGTITEAELAARHAAYEQTFSDEEAAQLLGITKQSFVNFRFDFGLEAKRLHDKWVHPREPHLAELYNEGIPDAQIAARLALSANEVAEWRRRRQLAPHGEQSTLEPQPVSREEALFLGFYRLGMGDFEIAAAAKTRMREVRRWRISCGLPPVSAADMDATGSSSQ